MRTKLRPEKDKQRAAYLGGFSLGAAKRLRQCLEQAKNKVRS